MSNENKTDIYSNALSALSTFSDLIIDFKKENPPTKPNEQPETLETTRVRLAWPQAKALLVVLAEVIMQHEKQYGDLPLRPEFSEKWERFLRASGVKLGGSERPAPEK